MTPLLMLVLIPLLGVVAIALRAPARSVALAASALCLGVVSWMACSYNAAGEFRWEWVQPWFQIPLLGSTALRFGVDGVNLPLLVLTGMVSVSALLVAPAKIERESEYYGCLLFVIAGAYGAFASMDLMCMYIFHEFALIPTFLLIGFWGNGYRRISISFQMALYLLAGSIVLLLGMLGLLFSLPPEIRTTDLRVLQEVLSSYPLHPDSQGMIYFFLLIGFGILVGLFPFHTWAPKSYSAAPTPAAMLHAGVLKKFGIYGLLRVAEPFCPVGAEEWNSLLLMLLIGNILFVGWAALSQKNFNDLLGYSSVMHMGYLFLGLASGTPAALTGVVLLSVAHGLSVSGLYAVQGMVASRTGEVEMASLGGVAKKIPVLGFLAVILAMASVGLPGLGNFAGEILIFFGSWQGLSAGWQTGAMLAALVGVVVSSVYMLRAVRAVFYGTEGKARIEGVGLSLTERVALLIPVVGLLVLGFVPTLVTDDAAASLSRWFVW